LEKRFFFTHIGYAALKNGKLAIGTLFIGIQPIIRGKTPDASLRITRKPCKYADIHTIM